MMNLETQYLIAAEEFTRYLAGREYSHIVAPGSSASALVAVMQGFAQKMEVELPPIYTMNRQESHDMYLAEFFQRTEVLEKVLANHPQGLIHFLDDYGSGQKASFLRNKVRVVYKMDCTTDIMVGDVRFHPEAIIFRYNPPLYNWLKGKNDSHTIRQKNYDRE